MAERGSSKFAGMFADRLEEAPVAPIPKPTTQNKPVRVEKPKPAPSVAPQRLIPEPEPVKTRRAGKRSDPAYKQFSVLLRKDTHRQTARILYDTEDGQDISELVQQLLEEWVKKQKL